MRAVTPDEMRRQFLSSRLTLATGPDRHLECMGSFVAPPTFIVHRDGRVVYIGGSLEDACDMFNYGRRVAHPLVLDDVFPERYRDRGQGGACDELRQAA